MNGRLNSLPYTVPIINQYAGRAVREDFLAHMSSKVPDFVKEGDDVKQLLQLAEKMAVEREERYIVERCSEYDMPLFDVPTDANLYD